MKKRLIADNWPAWALTAASFLFAAGVIFFLPDRIPMQWNGLHVNWYAPKIGIFALPCLLLLFTLLTPYFPVSKKPWFAPKLTSLAVYCMLALLLTLELYTAAFCFGLRVPVEYITLPEICVIVVLCFGYAFLSWRKCRQS